MRQLILYIIFVMSMVFSGCGEVSAASNSYRSQDSFAPAAKQEKKDGLAKIEPKQDQHNAVLEDASVVAYQACNSRPQRLLPTGNIHAGNNYAENSRLLFNRIRFLSSLLFAECGELLRQETAPFHFDVASKYYVICLRHLRC